MRDRLRLRLPLWVTPRFLYILGGIAAALAAAPGFAPLLAVAALAGAALLVATVADLAIGPRPSRLTIAREPVRHFALRVSARIGYAVENRSGYDVRVGTVESPARTIAYDDDEAIGDVPPRSRTTFSRAVTPVARGADAFGTIYAWYENRLGLIRRRLVVPAPAPFRVYPDLSAVERYGALHMRNRLIEAGLRKMRLKGTGTEFESLRDYASGDEFRAIDWKASARRGKLIVAQHEVERSQNVMIVLDCGRLMTPRLEDQRKFDFAITAALSVATIAGLANDKVGAVAFARDILAASAPRSTRASIAGLSEMLYDLEPRFEESDYAKAFAYLRDRLHKRSMIVFFTDVIDPVAQSAVLAELGTLAKRHLVVCVFMNDAAVANALAAPVTGANGAYEAAVALGLDHERRAAAATLNARGIITIDVPARKLTTALIDQYLRVKARGLI